MDGSAERSNHLSAGQEALAAIGAELGLDDPRSGEAAQLLLSIISLCWFPMVHARNVAPPSSRLDGCGGPGTAETHVIRLILHGRSRTRPTLTPTSTEHSSHD